MKNYRLMIVAQAFLFAAVLFTGHYSLLVFSVLIGGLQIQGPEFFEDFAIPVNAGVLTPAEQVLQKEVRKNKWIWGILATYEGHARAATGAATPLTYLPEFPLGIIDRFRIEGNHKTLGVREFLNLSGPTLWQFITSFQYRPLRARVKFNGGTEYQAIGNGSSANPAIVSSTNNDYDIRVSFLIPFPPQGIPIEQQALFMLKGDDWETLNFHFTPADGSGLFDNRAGTTVTFGAYGSGTGAVAGNPLLRVHLLRPNMGLSRNKYSPALTWRTFQGGGTLNSILQTSNLSDGLIARLSVTPDKYLRLLFKTGLSPTTAPTAGVNGGFGTLSDTIITRPKIKLSGKIVRNPVDTFTHKEWQETTKGTSFPNGYLPVDFLDTGDANTFFNVKGLTKDDFTFEGDLTAAANQIGELLEERIEGTPSAG